MALPQKSGRDSTPKVLANFSPGLLKPWEQKAEETLRNPEELRRISDSATFDTTLSGLRKIY
jgi:hypothetical protein